MSTEATDVTDQAEKKSTFQCGTCGAWPYDVDGRSLCSRPDKCPHEVRRETEA